MKNKCNVVSALGKSALALTLISICLVGGTLAKYTSEVTGTGVSMTAKWAFKAGDTVGGETISSFTLGSTTDGAVAKGKIAPGSSGTIPIYYDLTGTEVKTQFKISIKIEDTSKLPENMEFTCAGQTFRNADFNDDEYKDFMDKTFTIDAGTHTIIAADVKGQMNVTWQWPYYTSKTNDSSDVYDGKNANTANITIKVEATQLAS